MGESSEGLTHHTVLEQWVIYKHPRDYPHAYVLRRWTITRSSKDPQPDHACAVAPDLESIRALLPPGLYNLGRYDEDDPAILEVWI